MNSQITALAAFVARMSYDGRFSDDECEYMRELATATIRELDTLRRKLSKLEERKSLELDIK